MKRRTPRLLRRSDGSVSLYLIAITAAVFFFMAVLIDYVRIAAFERQAESSAYAAVRSMLSAYDETLYSRYGLFGRGGTDSASIAARVLEADAAAGRRNGRMELLRVRVEDIHVQTEDTLGNHPVLNRQILEEMKYKAPIDLTIEVAGKFRSLAGAMDEATRTVNRLEETRKLYDKRQRHLLAALGYQRDAAAALSGSGADGLIPVTGGAGTSASAASTATAVAAGYLPYVGWLEEDRAALEAWNRAAAAQLAAGSKEPLPPLPPLHTAEIQAYDAATRATAQELRQAVRAASERHIRLLRAAMDELDAAEAANTRMAALSHQTENGPDTGAVKLAESKAAAIGGGGQAAVPAIEGEMRSLREETVKLAHPSDWFGQYRDEIAAQGAALADVDAGAAAFQSSVLNALSSPSSGKERALSGHAGSLEAAYRQYIGRYSDTGAVLAARERSIREGQAADEERARLEKEAASRLGDARKLLGQAAALPKTSEAVESYRRLEELYERNRSRNEAVREAEAHEDGEAADDSRSVLEPSGEGGKYAQDSMNRADELFGGLAGMLGGVRDELYLNEYAVHRFASLQPRDVGAMSAAGGAPSGDSSAQAIALHNQEVEYVIYGMHDPVSNIAAAYGEIFALRVAIRTMEGLIERRSLGHPLVVLAAAALYGIEKALEDMADLAQSGTTPLVQYAAVRVEYRDYLRLFLFLHGSKQAKLSRIAALIEHHTGYNLHAVPTALSGTIGPSTNLWFVPGIAKAMARSGVLRGKVSEGRYETTRTVAWSY